jgi:lipopolysaccharide transport system ATP-binding protein
VPAYTLATGTYQVAFDVAQHNVRKINSDKVNLQFEVYPKDETGNRYFIENAPMHNSIVRQNWFHSLQNI